METVTVQYKQISVRTGKINALNEEMNAMIERLY